MHRKAIVISPTYKIILGALVLVVLAALLLKVPGLSERVFGFLEKGFGRAMEGRGLFIRIDPTKVVKTFHFYLSEDLKECGEYYTTLTNLLKENGFLAGCLIYATDRQPLGDMHRCAYVHSGAVLQDEGCGLSIKECLIDNGFVYTDWCPFTWPACLEEDDWKKLSQVEFTDIAEPGDKCKLDGEPQPQCKLLLPGRYRIKYGLICDNGMWRACVDADETKDVTIEWKAGPDTYTFNYDCKQEGPIFYWEEKEGKTLVFPTPKPETAIDFGTTGGTKSNLQGDQYFKVTVPSGKVCEVKWLWKDAEFKASWVPSKIDIDSLLPCESTSESIFLADASEIVPGFLGCLKRVEEGIYYAYAEYKENPYEVSVSVSDCEDTCQEACKQMKGSGAKGVCDIRISNQWTAHDRRQKDDAARYCEDDGYTNGEPIGRQSGNYYISPNCEKGICRCCWNE